MEYRELVLNRNLKTHDPKLFAKRMNGKMYVFRHSAKAEVFEFEGKKITAFRDTPHLVLALTDTWTDLGTPVDWGIEPLMSRIKEIDLWRDDSMLESMNRKRERKEELKRRSMKHEFEAIASEWRSSFARATNDIVVRANSEEKLKWE